MTALLQHYHLALRAYSVVENAEDGNVARATLGLLSLSVDLSETGLFNSSDSRQSSGEVSEQAPAPSIAAASEASSSSPSGAQSPVKQPYRVSAFQILVTEAFNQISGSSPTGRFIAFYIGIGGLLALDRTWFRSE